MREVGLKQANDDEIWMWARENRHTVITADLDFRNSGSARRSTAESDLPGAMLLRQNSVCIAESVRELHSDLLVIKRG